MKYSIRKRNTCRICGCEKAYNFFHVKDLPMPNGHYRQGEDDSVFTTDIDIYWCPECGCVQTLKDLDWSDYYTDYAYTVSRSSLVQRFMKSFAEETWSRFELQPGDTVVEIGSSDGLQLKYFKDLGAQVFGFEPSEPLVQAATQIGIETFECMFTNESIDLLPRDCSARVVLLQYTFDHLQDPLEFLRQVERILDKERGVLIIETHDLEKIFERNEACLFTHEHATYLTSESFASVFEKAGFRLICSDFVPEKLRRGNSLIVVATHKGSNIPCEPQRNNSILESLRVPETYTKFSQEISESHARLALHIRAMKHSGKKVAGYGAAARGLNTLVIAGVKYPDLQVIYDQNKSYHGLFMPTLNIPVAPPEQLFKDGIDELIVFCYGYLREIKEFYNDFIKNGGKIISMLDFLKQSNEWRPQE